MTLHVAQSGGGKARAAKILAPLCVISTQTKHRVPHKYCTLRAPIKGAWGAHKSRLFPRCKESVRLDA